MLNWMLAILAQKEVLTDDEAMYLANKLQREIQASNFIDANRTIERVLKDYKLQK